MQRVAIEKRFEIGFWLAFAVAVFALGFVYSVYTDMYRFGTASWPQALAVLVALCALGQLYSDLRGFDDGEEASEEKSYIQQIREQGLAYQLNLATAMILPLIYTILLEYTGYYFTTPFFLAAYLYLIGERRAKFLIVVPLATYVFLTVLFTTILYVGLPIGYLPGFYDINNFIVSILR